MWANIFSAGTAGRFVVEMAFHRTGDYTALIMIPSYRATRATRAARSGLLCVPREKKKKIQSRECVVNLRQLARQAHAIPHTIFRRIRFFIPRMKERTSRRALITAFFIIADKYGNSLVRLVYR